MRADVQVRRERDDDRDLVLVELRRRFDRQRSDDLAQLRAEPELHGDADRDGERRDEHRVEADHLREEELLLSERPLRTTAPERLRGRRRF